MSQIVVLISYEAGDGSTLQPHEGKYTSKAYMKTHIFKINRSQSLLLRTYMLIEKIIFLHGHM